MMCVPNDEGPYVSVWRINCFGIGFYVGWMLSEYLNNDFLFIDIYIVMLFQIISEMLKYLWISILNLVYRKIHEKIRFAFILIF